GTVQTPRLKVDFRLGWPDIASFPRGDWMWAMREVSRTAPAEALGYGDPRGSARLREVLAGYLRRVRGAVAAPERIVVCAGSEQGRRRVVEGADARGAISVEDDYDAALRYAREPVGALQGIAPRRVAMIGTVSKSLSPGLRLGWIVCPAALLDAVVEEKHQDDR